MKKIECMFEKLTPIMDRVANNPTLKGISNGMIGSFSITLVGSICLLLVVFPINQVPTFLSSIGLTPVLLKVNSITIRCLALYMVVLLTNALVISYDSKSKAGIPAAMVSLMCFLIVTPLGNTLDDVIAIPTYLAWFIRRIFSYYYFYHNCKAICRY